MRRALVALVALCAAVLLAEGALSLCAGRSLRTLVVRQADVPDAPLVQSDAERYRAAAQTPGPYRGTEDPLVGYALKAEAELNYLDGRPEGNVRTDSLGLRVRPGPAPDADAFRIVVLGDSVAFGLGLAAEEVLAARLEAELAAARGPDARAIACRTVAVPSWNYRNALRFLLDHLAELEPDLVLYLPVANDLDDSYGTNEAGQRREAEDPGVPHPLLFFRPEWTFLGYVERARRAAGESVDEARAGPDVYCAGLTASSRWRLTDLVEELELARERLARRGTPLVLVPHEQSDFQHQLRAEMAEHGLELPVIPLLEDMQPGDTLGWDPHPSAQTVRAFAVWLARDLLAGPWLPDGYGESGGSGPPPLPEVPASLAERRGRELGPEAARAWRREFQARVEGALEPVLDAATLRGMRQTYGGINLDASLRPEFAAVLPRGRRLRVRLAPLSSGNADGLYPLEVGVYVEERRVGTLSVAASGESEQVFALGPAEAAAAYEVRLLPRDWRTVSAFGKSTVASARLVELESLAE